MAKRKRAVPRRSSSALRARSTSRTRTARTAPARAKKSASPRASGRSSKERRRRNPETLRLRAFGPGFTVDDLGRSMRFYTDVLGFIVGERWTEGDTVRGVSLKAGACSLGLSQDDWSKGRGRQKGQGVRLWCETGQDVDALAARVKAAGWPLTEEPQDQPWGVRTIALDDPDGYHLTIYQNKD